MKEGIETSYSLPAIAPVASTAVVVGEGGSKLAGGRYGRNKSVASKGKTKAAAAIAMVGSPAVLSAPSSMVSAGTEESQFVTPPAPPSFKGKNALFQ